MIINNEESAMLQQQVISKEENEANNLLMGEGGANGGLATIKDEDSNADSDFSGDEQQPSSVAQASQPNNLT